VNVVEQMCLSTLLDHRERTFTVGEMTDALKGVDTDAVRRALDSLCLTGKAETAMKMSGDLAQTAYYAS